ncbi:unnamed protein product [Paramecium octaurelia]|uniref:Uncharacterized protein n=1 Tax=Paramecium octaurelia TaxID=43137 RepID=A0A8S1X708_PAROT|nr:unnamed protein product [Paramecium octaurelia]
MKKKLSLSSKPLSYIQLDDNGRTSYCKTHCLKYELFEYRNGKCYICCDQKECNQNNDPLNNTEIVMLLNQILVQSISYEFKQEQKQRITTLKEHANKAIQLYCDRAIQIIDKNCEKQDLLNEKITYILDNLQNENILLQAYEILKFQELDCVNVKIGVIASLTQEFYRILTKYENTLNCINSIIQDDYFVGNNEYNVLKNQIEVGKMKCMQFQRQHEISIKYSRQSSKRIYQDIKNHQIIVVSTGQEFNNQIRIIKPTQYSLFGQFDSLKNTISAEVFCISPNCQFYAWGSNTRIQTYQLQTQTQIQQHSIFTSDQKINFWGLNNRNWELNSSFNILPERVHDLIFIEDGKILICQSNSKLTFLIKENNTWIMYQQIHQSFITTLWSKINQMIITTNLKKQIQIWQRNKKGLFQLISTEWDPEYNSNNYEVNPLQIYDEGSLLGQCQNNKLKIWSILEGGRMQVVFEQEIDEQNVIITNNFTNLLAQNEKSLIWYQLIYHQH